MPRIEPLFRDEFHAIHDLYENAKRNQWNATTGVDWEEEIGWESDLDHDTAVALRAFRIGTQYVGEAMAVTSDFAGPLPPDREARAFLATQFIDEVRHAGVFYRYLEKLGAPPCEVGEGTEVLRQFFARLQNYAESLVLCTQVLFEGLGVDLFQVETDQGPCPLLKSIFERVRRDEARHIAFGTLYLDHLVPKLNHAERHALQEQLDDGLRVFFAQVRMMAQNTPATPLEYQVRSAAYWQDAFPKALGDVDERLRHWDLRLNL